MQVPVTHTNTPHTNAPLTLAKGLAHSHGIERPHALQDLMDSIQNLRLQQQVLVETHVFFMDILRLNVCVCAIFNLATVVVNMNLY